MTSVFKPPVPVRVTYRYGAYNTATVAGQRASSTSSAAAAAGRLVDKLCTHLQLLPGTLAAEAVPAEGLPPGQTLWHIKTNEGAGA